MALLLSFSFSYTEAMIIEIKIIANDTAEGSYFARVQRRKIICFREKGYDSVR